MRVHVKVPATSANLGAGLDCLGVALNIWNELIVEEAFEKEVSIYGEGQDELPKDSRNLVLKSFNYFFSHVERIDPDTLPTFKFCCKNNIPLERGLGSSTAATVAGLMAAAALAPYLQSRKKTSTSSASTELTRHPYSCPAMSTHADAATNAPASKLIVSTPQNSSSASLVLGTNTTKGWRPDTCKIHSAPDDVGARDLRPALFVRQRARSGVAASGVSSTGPSFANGLLSHRKTFAAMAQNNIRLQALLQVASALECRCSEGERTTGTTGGEHVSFETCVTKPPTGVISAKKSGVTFFPRGNTKAFYVMKAHNAFSAKHLDSQRWCSTNNALSSQCSTKCSLTHAKTRQRQIPTQVGVGDSMGRSTFLDGPEKRNDDEDGEHAKKWIAAEISFPPNLKLVIFVPADRVLTAMGEAYADMQMQQTRIWQCDPRVSIHAAVTGGCSLSAGGAALTAAIMKSGGLAHFYLKETLAAKKNKHARDLLPRTVRLEDAVHNAARSALFIYCLTTGLTAAASTTKTPEAWCGPAAAALPSSWRSWPCCRMATAGMSQCCCFASAPASEKCALEPDADSAAEAVFAELLQEAMNDRLHQPYRRALSPHLDSLIASANHAGAMGTALSGAGPSVVAFCVAQRAAGVAKAMEAAAERINKKGKVLITEASAKGAHVVDLVGAADYKAV